MARFELTFELQRTAIDMAIINELIGKKVTVYSKGDSERQDVGVLEAADEQFLKVRKNDHEYHLFGITQIRMVKPFDPH